MTGILGLKGGQMGDSGFNFLDALADLADRLPAWIMVLIALLFVSLPLGLASLLGATEDMLRDAQWRPLMLPPTIIIYILILVPYMRSSSHKVADALRPVVKVDDAEYARIVADATRIRPRNEAVAFAAGALFALLIWGLEGARETEYPLLLYSVFFLSLVMFGMMGWVIYLSLSRSRLTAVLHRQPIEIDIFDISPFESVGRQSLMLSLSLVGGTVLSLFFVFDPESFLSLGDLIVYVLLSLATFAVFFLNMRYTHRALANEKKRELSGARKQVNRAYRQLQALSADGADTVNVTSEINAWTTMETRLKETRTWPYNTEMMRTLTFSVLTPIAIGLSRVVIYLLQSSGQ